MTDVQKITTASFKEAVVETSKTKPVLVDFWAEWCGPCLSMTPRLNELAEQLGDSAVVAKVNVDDERALSAMYQIMSIPTFLLFKDGQKVAQISGVQTTEALKEQITALM